VPPIGYEDKDKEQFLSFTYSEDVINVIMQYSQAIKSGQRSDKFIAVNVACEEQITLPEVLSLIFQMSTGEPV
jgi:hypothetical protein